MRFMDLPPIFQRTPRILTAEEAGIVKRLFFVILVAGLLLGGCAREPEKTAAKPVSRVVVRVEVDGLRGEEAVQRRYESQEKMGAILDYLRPLRSLGPAEVDPERLRGDVYEIRVWRADGEHDTYRLRSDRYLSKNCKTWQVVERRQAELLYPLLQAMESDVVQGEGKRADALHSPFIFPQDSICVFARIMLYCF